MKYNLRLTDKAANFYAELSPFFADELDRHLDQLAQTPTSVSVESCFPFPQGRLIYGFKITDGDGIDRSSQIHFSLDESTRTIDVIAILIWCSKATLTKHFERID